MAVTKYDGRKISLAVSSIVRAMAGELEDLGSAELLTFLIEEVKV